jgi:hypothetical protein
MSDGQGTNPSGHVEETPEAAPLEPPTMQDHYAGQPLAGSGSGAGTGGVARPAPDRPGGRGSRATGRGLAGRTRWWSG